MTALTAGDYLAIAGLLSGFVGVPAAVLLSMLKRMEVSQARFRDELRQEQAGFREEMRGDLRRLEDRIGDVESGKVSHVDWVRVTTSHLNRLNALSSQMAELGGKIDGSLGIGAGVMRIANALERKADEDE